MAVAKRRQSSARRDMRRSQWMKMIPPASSACPSCGGARLPHHACKSCGWYGPEKGGRIVAPPKAEAAEAPKNS